MIAWIHRVLIFVGAPRDSVLSNCSNGHGVVMVGDSITMESDVNPDQSIKYFWTTNGSAYSDPMYFGESFLFGMDLVGEVNVTCFVSNYDYFYDYDVVLTSPSFYEGKNCLAT